MNLCLELPSAYVALAAKPKGPPEGAMAANRRHFTVASSAKIHKLGQSTVGQRLTVATRAYAKTTCTCHGDGERFFPLDGKNLSCYLRRPVKDRSVSSGQKRDRTDGSTGGLHPLGNFSLQLLVTKGGKCIFIKKSPGRNLFCDGT